MAAAEEDPECWGRTLETWPEESDAAPSLEDLLPWVREAFGEEFVEVQFPSQALVPQPATARPTRTTLRLEQVVQDAVQKGGLKTPPSINLKSAEPQGIRQQLDRLMSSLQEQRWSPDGMGAERQPRTIARQNYDIFKNPFGAADEFTLATKKAERRLNSKRNQESSKESSQDPTMPVRRRKASDTPRKPKSEIVRGQKLERLDYLHTCRGTMGEARFAMERQRLEMQADLRSAEKYSVEEKPKQARCAFSAQTRTSNKTMGKNPYVGNGCRVKYGPRRLRGPLAAAVRQRPQGMSASWPEHEGVGEQALRPAALPSAFTQLNAETKEVQDRAASHIANRSSFNLVIGVMLCINTVIIGIETDYSRGRALQDRLPFFVLETLFTALFLAEVIIRMHHLGWDYATDPWNIFDYSLVVFSWTDMLVAVTEVESGGLRLAASLRLFRLLRVVRSIRGVKILSGLWLVIQGLLDSYKTVLWIAFAMAIFIFCFGAALCVLGGQDRFAFEYWYLQPMYLGSVLRAMFTTLQVATFDDWADSVARPLFRVAPMAAPAVFLLIFVISFGTLNILVAVMVERISVITADNRLRAEQSRKRMEAILLESVVEELHANDRDGSGDLSQKEFKKMIRIPSLVKKLGLLGIGLEEAESLFEIMDVGNSGLVTPEEFIAGLQKVKGAAKGVLRALLALRGAGWAL
ncbi:Cation channel sperm-associated protein 1 [Symbiodinium microadriaticum]|uniref:Cation channel sperm-associated protein 1 n=1 Tax=Symbiodinium microadriaticum TaxID=2951 RepID=A0A1Q9E0N2_SYMMI|nr:Cation channel sperm-associated protein 1 [Symbiodinium microadriaticum]